MGPLLPPEARFFLLLVAGAMLFVFVIGFAGELMRRSERMEIARIRAEMWKVDRPGLDALCANFLKWSVMTKERVPAMEKVCFVDPVEPK